MLDHTTEYNLLHSPQFKKSLSGNQIETLLNYFLLKALYPITQTLWFKNELALLIIDMIHNAKRKSARKPRLDSINNIFNAITSLENNEILTQLKESSIDRNLISHIINNFCEQSNLLIDNEEEFFRSLNNGDFNLKSSNDIMTIENSFFGLPKTFLIKTNKEVSFWFFKYLKFKELILSKYYRLAFKCAKMTKFNKPNVDEDCLFKSLILSMNTALDKYTAEKGTLTSYIQLWFKSTIANPRYDFEMGRPFKLSNYGKQKMIDTGLNPNAISTDDEEFAYIESKLDDYLLNNKLETFEISDLDLLGFINSIEDPDIDLVKIILNIPQINPNFKLL